MENGDSDSQEKPIYQFYTIINNAGGLVYNQEEEQENLYNIEENDENAEQIVYVTINQTDEGEEDSNNIDGLINDNIYENITSTSNGLKLVTLEDGQIYITSADNSDVPNLESNCQLLTNINENEDSQPYPNDVTLVTNEDEIKIIESAADGDSNYRKIRLEDGTCAFIDASVWDSLIQETSPQETETKNKRKFHCTYVNCGKSFTTSHHLQVHNRSHTGDRPHACNVEGCDKAFTTGYSLKAHLRTHTGEKPYGCTICLKHFKTSGDLQKHIRTHTGEKPFKCPIEGCDKSFTTSNIRKVHIRSHTGERPYVCEVAECGKSFASATNYKNHMRIHSGEKPYLCSVPGCGKRFTEYSSLYKHNAVHQPYKMFRCDCCDQLFKFENTLKLHKKTAHTIIKMEDGTEFYFSDQQKSMVLEINEADDLNAIMDPNLLTDESNLQYDDGEL